MGRDISDAVAAAFYYYNTDQPPPGFFRAVPVRESIAAVVQTLRETFPGQPIPESVLARYDVIEPNPVMLYLRGEQVAGAQPGLLSQLERSASAQAVLFTNTYIIPVNFGKIVGITDTILLERKNTPFGVLPPPIFHRHGPIPIT